MRPRARARPARHARVSAVVGHRRRGDRARDRRALRARERVAMFDTWHTFRGPTDEAQLEKISGARIGSVQINDAPVQPGANLIAETMSARLLPGEGAIPLVRWLRWLDAIGSTAPIGVEVFSSALDALAPVEVGRRCGAAARAVLAAAHASPSQEEHDPWNYAVRSRAADLGRGCRRGGGRPRRSRRHLRPLCARRRLQAPAADRRRQERHDVRGGRQRRSRGAASSTCSASTARTTRAPRR